VKKVVIVQRTLKFYRVKFFELLKEKCSKNNIELVLIYGKDDTITFNDSEISWGIKVKNYSINFWGKKLYYQNVWKYIKNADLIIVEQANKHIINYVLWLMNLLRIKKLAFWGHGINFQENNTLISEVSEIIKKQFTKKVHWFFAYTELSKNTIVRNGFPSERVTILNNTIAVEDFQKEIENYDEAQLKKLKKQVGIKSNNVCIYVGGMYKAKRLEFLLKSLEKVKEEINDFEMIFIGDGPQKEVIINFARINDWAHYLGVKPENNKIPYLLVSKLLIVPSLVGLVMLDSFVFGLPLITTNAPGHGPEISYLENGINGIITKNELKDYANTIILILKNNDERERIKLGCQVSMNKYTLGNMVENYVAGILKALN